MRKFSATLDGQARTITFLVLIVIVIPFVTIFNQYLKLHDPWMLLGPVLVTAALLAALIYRPKSYGLDSAGLHVHRMMKTATIALKDIRSVAPISPKELGAGFCTWGSSGFLGYFGRFLYKNHGIIMLYATDRSKMLLVTLSGDRRVIITPEDTTAFMTAFHEIMRKK